MTITVNAQTVPTFNQVAAICSGSALAALPTTSTNSITGTWSPALNNTATTTYTFTPTAGQCATTATMTITINAVPLAATVGVITQPTCATATGSVVLGGLPATGTWTINPGVIPGSGTSKTLTGLTVGTHAYTVTSESGCISSASSNIVINAQPVNVEVHDIDSEGEEVCKGFTLKLTDETVGGVWSANKPLIATISNTGIVAGVEVGTVTISYTVTNGCGNTTKSKTITVKNCGAVSGGDDGGLESKSLGDAVVKRVYNKAFSSLQKPIDYSSLTAIPVNSPRAFGTGGSTLKLSDILPKQLNTNNNNFTSYITTPTDIPSITNAKDVLSIDYTLNNQAKAVSFGTQTSNAVYDHTKAICDRLKGSVLLNMQNVLVNNMNMVAYTLQDADGSIEYAMSFAIGAKAGRNSYTLQSNWLNQDYSPDETMYNIQLWAISQDIVIDLANKVVSNLQVSLPVQPIAGAKLPDTYITSGNRDRTDLVLSVTNNQTNSNGYFVIEDKSNELSATTIKRTLPFTLAANGKANITVPVSDTYESTISMYINNQLQDVVYMADGTWSYGAGPASTVTSFKVSNDTNKTYSSDELPLFRNVQVSGNSADYVSIFKLMKGGAIAQDLSAYKTLKFAAEGGYNLRITLVKSSIVNWSDQYNTLIPLDKASKEYFISLDAFTSALSKDKINANDITTIVFSIEVGNGQNTAINTTLNSISFTKKDASYLQSLSAKEVQLYPNPATGNRFTCSFMSDKSAQLTLRVIDMTTGQIMHTQQVAAVTGINNVQVDINRRNAGSSVYIIALDGESVQYKKAKIIAGN